MYNFQGWYDTNNVRLTGVDRDKDLPNGIYNYVYQYKGKTDWGIRILKVACNNEEDLGGSIITHNLNPYKGGIPEQLLKVLPQEAQQYFVKQRCNA